MKLLIFCPYYPPHIGGLESHADEFNKHLSKKNFQITIFTPHIPQNSPEKEILHNKVEVVRFPAFEIIPNYPLPKFWNLKFWKLFSNLFKNSFDLVISRTRFFNTSLIALIYSKTKGVKWIHIEHGSDFVQLSSKLNSLIAKFYDHTFGRIVFKYSDLNISISKAVQNFVYKFDKRISPVIYRGLEIEKIEKIKPDLKLKNKYKDKIIISFVGRLYKWKGVQNSLEAIKNLSNKDKAKIVFLIIGDGEDYSKLKEITSKETSIKMLGSIDRKKALSILKISDIYIHSAYPGGGLSTSLLEAMLFDCSVIATPSEGADEVIKNKENGILINNSDSKKIKGEITRLLENNSLRKKLSKNSNAYIKNNFNWNNSIEKYEKVFRKITK
jgi:glycosyltransferase involved in cell wall biosynthesis